MEQCRDSDDFLNCVLLETQRLYPPFIGGRRLATKVSDVTHQWLNLIVFDSIYVLSDKCIKIIYTSEIRDMYVLTYISYICYVCRTATYRV